VCWIRSAADNSKRRGQGEGAVRLRTETCSETPGVRTPFNAKLWQLGVCFQTEPGSETLRMRNHGRGGVLSDSEAARLAEEEENVRSRIQEVARALVYLGPPT